MRHRLLPFAVFIGSFLFSMSVATAGAQQTAPATETKPTPTESPKAASADRLIAAKNLFIKKTGAAKFPTT